MSRSDSDGLVDAVIAFCALVETLDTLPIAAALRQLVVASGDLLRAAAAAPWFDYDGDWDEKVARPSTEREERELQRRLERHFDGRDRYREVVDPTEPGEEPCEFAVASDLAEAHSDLKDGLLLAERGDLEGAIAYWRMNLTIHWGFHVTSALR